ncbi:MAG: GTP cyclohydrolase I FolE [Candidatus Symbiodolus clandestinus]
MELLPRSLLETVSEPLSPDALKVRMVLEARGLEIPRQQLPNYDARHCQQQIAEHIRAILQLLQLDLNDDSLINTPNRVAKMYLEELFIGLNYANFPEITLIANQMQYNEIVVVRDIILMTTCEHHLITIDGVAKVAYMPDKHIIGLSKINRIVQFFARRPQVQERLTKQILVALQTLLETENVAVSIDATHYCVKARGVGDTQSKTTTSVLGGLFKHDKASRQLFLQGA